MSWTYLDQAEVEVFLRRSLRRWAKCRLEGFFYGKRFSGREENFANWLRKRNEAKWKIRGKELEGNAKSSEMEMK